MADLPPAPFSADDARQFRHCIEAGVSIAGRIHFPGDASIDGKLQGEVHADQLLVISEGAMVEADIRARRLVVSGTLRGDICQSGTVEIRRTAKMFGRIEATNLVVESGAVFDGMVAVTPPQGATDPIASTSEETGETASAPRETRGTAGAPKETRETAGATPDPGVAQRRANG